MYKKPIFLRGIAFFIDIFIIVLIGLLFNHLFDFGTLVITSSSYSFKMNWWESTLVATGYFGLIEYLLSGKSIGKLICGLEVRYDNLNKINSKQTYFLRGFFKGLIILSSGISMITTIVREDNKSLHDLAFKTIVVKKVKASEYITEN